EEAKALLDLLLGDQNRLDAEPGADGDRVLAREGRAEAVGDRPRLDRDGAARLQGVVKRRRALRLDGDDLRGGPQALHGGRDPGDESAAADRNDDDVDVGHVLDQLEADGALPGDHEWIVERVDERPAGLLDQLVETVERLGRPGRAEVDLGAVSSRRGDLRRVRV